MRTCVWVGGWVRGCAGARVWEMSCACVRVWALAPLWRGRGRVHVCVCACMILLYTRMCLRFLVCMYVCMYVCMVLYICVSICSRIIYLMLVLFAPAQINVELPMGADSEDLAQGHGGASKQSVILHIFGRGSGFDSAPARLGPPLLAVCLLTSSWRQGFRWQQLCHRGRTVGWNVWGSGGLRCAFALLC